MEEVELSEVVKHLVKTQPVRQVVDVKFLDSDINYLQRKTGLDHKVVAHAIRSFGSEVVLESLRRFQVGWSSAYFWGVCKQVAGGEPYGNAVDVSTPSPPPPASQGEA